MVDNPWSFGESETTTIIVWFQSGDQDGSGVKKKLVSKKS